MLPTGIKVHVAVNPINMNKSFDGLLAEVSVVLKRDPMSQNLFVFFNKQKNKIKILYYDRTGHAVWYKRLSKGRYQLPRMQGNQYQITISELNLLLEGIELTSKRLYCA